MQTLLAWSCPGQHDVAAGLARVESWYASVDPSATVRRDTDVRDRLGLALWHDESADSQWPVWWQGRAGDGSVHSVASLYAPLGLERVTGATALPDAPGELGWRLIEQPARMHHLAVPFVLAEIHVDELHVFNDVLGVGRLFELRAGTLTVWSNRPVAAIRFAGVTARADAGAWRYQAAVDWCMGDTTPYESVTCVRPGSHILAGPEGVSTESSTVLDGFDPTISDDALSGAVVEQVAEALTASARSLAALWPGQVPVIGLSGGKDSRLVAAAFVSAGVEITCRTNSTIAGEGEIAAALVAALPSGSRPRHELFESAATSARIDLSPDHALDRADRWHDLTEGLRSPVYLSTNPPKGFPGSGRAILNGSAGEIARGNYYPPDLERVESMPAGRRWSEYESILSARVCLPHGISDSSRAGAVARMAEVLAVARAAGIDDARALDWFYLDERVRRWGTFPESQVTVTPLLTPEFVRVALTVPPHLRPGAELHRRVTAALVPEWAQIPYFDADLKTRTKSRRRRVWQEPDVEQIAAILADDGSWTDAFDAREVRAVWARAVAGSAGERDDLLLARVLWNHTFEDHCRRVNGTPTRERPAAAVAASGPDALAGARRVATRLNDVAWAKRLARTRLGRRIRRILGV